MGGPADLSDDAKDIMFILYVAERLGAPAVSGHVLLEIFARGAENITYDICQRFEAARDELMNVDYVLRERGNGEDEEPPKIH